MKIELDDFTRAYIDAMLWAETDDNSDPLDKNYGLEDFDKDALARIVEDCKQFQADNAADLDQYDHPQYSAAEMGGHDYWLTRNHHGTGFWDRTKILPANCRSRLTLAAELAGELYVYIGDDGKIYID